jgi:predicted DNA-binding protein
VTDNIIETFDPEIPVSAGVAAEREAVRWAMTHSLADLEVDEAESARLAAELPTEGPTSPEEVDAMMVTTSLRLPLGVQRRVQAYAKAHGMKPTAVMRGWIEQMLTAAEVDRPISLQEALRVLAQLPESRAA